jgi:hypothetical protein
VAILPALPETIVIADYGSSQGHNSFGPMAGLQSGELAAAVLGVMEPAQRARGAVISAAVVVNPLSQVTEVVAKLPLRPSQLHWTVS